MKHFDIQAWHVVTFFLTFIVGIFKDEIKNMAWSILQLCKKKFAKGQEIQILNSSGTWNNATIIGYHLEIPFIKSGGVVVTHIDENEHEHEEVILFNTWKQLRKRSKAK